MIRQKKCDMLHIVLFEPEIPPNTGNIIRLAANTGFSLHLIEPLGFSLDNKQLRRAGLDYEEWADVQLYRDYASFTKEMNFNNLFAFTTKATTPYHRAKFVPGDVLLFGPESRGLPMEILDSLDQQHKLRLPMVGNSRSLNLSNSVAIAVYEAWRQNHFEGA